MDEYFDIGQWFAIPTFLIVEIWCIFYAVDTYGWFLGIPLGLFVGAFFSSIAAMIAGLLWPLIAVGLLLLLTGVID